MPFWPFIFFHGSSEKNHLMATNVFPIFFLLFQVEWKTHLVATRHFPPKLCGKSHGGHQMFSPQPLWEITWRLLNVDKSSNGHYIINLGSNEMFLIANLCFFIQPWWENYLVAIKCFFIRNEKNWKKILDGNDFERTSPLLMEVEYLTSCCVIDENEFK
jgi:hypothetical protein